MSSPIQTANVYTDLHGLSAMGRAAGENSSEDLRFVAQQFEALFLQMMLKSTHGLNEEDGLFEGEQTEFYQDWYDKQLAIHLSTGKGIGIADMLVEQLKQQKLFSANPQAVLQDNALQDKKASSVTFPVPEVTVAAPAVASVAAAEKIQQAVSETPETKISEPKSPQLGTPESFVRHLLPYAETAAKQLGVEPEFLLAQAALETGWGKYVNKSANGDNSHNLFNIKADHRWQGDSVNVATLEYRDGLARRENARFRAYDSYRESFQDYVDFIQAGGRYQDALAVAHDGPAYTRELARAGYATDPEYSSKIIGIVEGEPFNKALRSVKL